MSKEAIIVVIIFVAFIGGLIVGWAARSFQFGLDRDCANPDHKKEQ